MAQARINVQAPIKRLFAKRWSTRAFVPDRPVAAEHLAACLEAARWAPSCFGEEPWRFVIADRFADESAWKDVLDALAAKNRLWAKNAPVLIVTACVPNFSSNDRPNRWCEYDAGQAALSLCLQATALGLASHQMGGFDPDAVRCAARLPEKWRVMSIIALGHPAGPEVAPSEFHEREIAPRTRKPIEEIAAAGRWGTPWQPPQGCGWEARYQETEAEKLPWFHAGLDADIERALSELGLDRGRLLDLGCGPGTQAVALARRGFHVTASDISWTAVSTAKNRATEAGVDIDFVVDDVLNSQLTGPFDLIVDRGVFHCFSNSEDQKRYLATIQRLLAPQGVLLLKCFHKEETREQGPPGRYDEEDIRRLFTGYTILNAWRSEFPSKGEPNPPKALFCILKRKGEPT